MNRMVFQLTERILNEENQKNEYRAVLLSMTEGVRNRRFIEFVKDAAISDEALEDDFSYDNKNIINIRSTGFKNSGNLRVGTLIVLNNVTHVRLLEYIRKDFVANVSHELKTPLSTIKGFVETIFR